MIDAEILRPVVVLLAWTMVMWVWMYMCGDATPTTYGINP